MALSTRIKRRLPVPLPSSDILARYVSGFSFVVVVIGLSSLGAHIVQRNKGSVDSDLNGEAVDDDKFGWSVALSSDGTRVAIGAPYNGNNGDGAGYVRVYDPTTKVGSDLNGEAAGDGFGYSVALSSDGTRVAIGAPYNDGNGNVTSAGHVRVYDWTGSQWTQVGSDLNGEAVDDWFGESVALSSDGTRVAIGATGNDDNGEWAGHVRVYDWTEGTRNWTQVGSDLNGEAVGGGFGESVALSSDGTRVAIGAPYNHGNGTNAGHVRVFGWTGNQWTQVGTDLKGEDAFDLFGHSVALSSDGTRLAIGAPLNGDNGNGAGRVRIYDWTDGNWTQVGSDLHGETPVDQFGYSVALSSDGTRVAIGARDFYGNGDVRIYDWTGSLWMQVGSGVHGDATNDQIGWSLALSSDGTVVAIGGIWNDGDASKRYSGVTVYNVSA